ncbi:MAG: hypothetical protein FWB72_05660 [Firmicutes bacterium]|nr:hypothetical protein [Bacillota bacterium]
MSQIQASAQVLAQYALDLNVFINNVSHKLVDLMNYHKKVGNNWQDDLYVQFGGEIEKVKNLMLIELQQLEELKKVVSKKAEELAELEKTQF